MKRNSSAGFSLVEVAIALAIASFCLVTIAGLLSVGLTSTQASSQESVMANIAGQVTADLRATSSAPGTTSPFYKIAMPLSGDGSTISMPTSFYVLPDGSKVNLNNTPPPNFRVWVGFLPPATAGLVISTTARILITWPAQQAPNIGPTGWPTTYGGSYETMLSLNRN